MTTPFSPDDHEVLHALAAHDLPPCPTLRDMLNEDFSHCTERRGCGFTQATRLLADYLRRHPATAASPEFESSLPEKPKVGSCNMAKKLYLEIAHADVNRKARINVIVDDGGNPLLLEKLHWGDSHSCISVAPVMMNRVRLPPGSLFAADYDDALPVSDGFRPCRKLKGHIIPASACRGFRFLRLTTLAVPPAIRARTFGTQFARQADGGFIGYDTTELSALAAIAQAQV